MRCWIIALSTDFGCGTCGPCIWLSALKVRWFAREVTAGWFLRFLERLSVQFPSNCSRTNVSLDASTAQFLRSKPVCLSITDRNFCLSDRGPSAFQRIGITQPLLMQALLWLGYLSQSFSQKWFGVETRFVELSKNRSSVFSTRLNWNLLSDFALFVNFVHWNGIWEFNVFVWKIDWVGFVG
jgi:hypothetical protein